ncbi:hydrolase [Dyella subtropica]|uniref:hydrolase n=1 Tax=Dyella subtropica TaxID=2992127 RepID=UPI0022527D19|nr:hydrolase [Dyella subtropica]
MDKLDSRSTALVLIDLQMGIAGFAGGPHSADQVYERAGALAARFRALKAPVILVRVGYAPDFADAPRQMVDRQPPIPPGGLPAHWWDFPEQLAVADSDIRIVKRQWGAFYGTDLDLQLRRRGIQRIVLAGITTNNGVESTARAGWEMGYSQVLVEDAMSAANAEFHRFSIDNIMPRLGLVRSTAQILEALR